MKSVAGPTVEEGACHAFAHKFPKVKFTSADAVRTLPSVSTIVNVRLRHA